MRAIAQLFIAVGNLLGLRFLTNIGNGMTRASVVGDRVKAVKNTQKKSGKEEDDKSES